MESEAEEAYRRVSKLPVARLGMARIYLRRHFEGWGETDWRKAALAELEPIKSSPGDEPIRILRHFASGRWAEALVGEALAPDRSRYDDVLQISLGLAALEMGRWDEALLWLDAAVRLRRSDSTSLYWKGVVQGAKGGKVEAVDAFTRAIKGAPSGWRHLPDAEKRLADLRN
jgi:tetratricopeptide (TPR) repeat protein